MIDDIRPPVRPGVNTDHNILPPPVRAGGQGSAQRQPALAHRGSTGVEPKFMTPDRIAARDSLLAKAGLAGAQSETGNSNGKSFKPAQGPKNARTIKLFGRPVSLKKFIIIFLVILLAAGGAVAFALTRPPEDKPQEPTRKATPAPPPPPPIVSGLTGIPVSKEQSTHPVIGVMIENSGNARPQSGLKEAGVVYEAIAEAGITRFLALFQEQDTSNIGPIRSARPYYLDWAMAFDASFAHVGGSPDALQRIKAIGVKDMDQFHNSGAYHRITSRYAPHNVYSSIPILRNLSISKGYTTSTYTPFERKKESPYKTGDTRVVANVANLGISGPFYNVRYDYDAVSNSYKRSMAGVPHMDADSNTQLQPKVVVALVQQYSLMADGYHSQYNTIGSGKMFVFQDGSVVSGTWSKGEPKEQFVFKEDNGKVFQLNPGQTWISVVGDPGKVTWQ